MQKIRWFEYHAANSVIKIIGYAPADTFIFNMLISGLYPLAGGRQRYLMIEVYRRPSSGDFTSTVTLR